MKLLYPILLCVFVFSSCMNKPDELIESKINSALKIKLAEVARNSSSEKIQILGKCSEQISETMKVKLVETGADIQSVIGQIFTAEASAEEIKKLTNIDFVLYLELSVERTPNK